MMRWRLFLILTVILGASFMTRVGFDLRQQTRRLESELAVSRVQLQQRDAVIGDLRNAADEAMKRYQRLQATHVAIRQARQQSDSERERRYDANPALRDWSRMPLPDDVIRLYQQPAATGAADYLATVHAIEPLPLAREPATHAR